jgi:hypothetical protein
MITGIFAGWATSGARQAIEAIVSSGTSHISLCARHDIIITDEDWPYGVSRNYVGDNGELKCEETDEFSRTFHIGLEFVQANRGDKHGSEESNHHSTHLKLDKKLPGYTGGKPTPRGEPHPAENALYTEHEYMRELIQWILRYNNEEVPELAPMEMINEAPPIPLTRLNIFKWLRRHGATSELQVDSEKLRIYGLTEVEAVVHKNGVFLKVDVDGYKTILPRVRYVGDELVASGLPQQVKRTGKVIETRVRLDPHGLTNAWLPTHQGMVSLECEFRKREELAGLCLADLIDLASQLGSRKKARQSKDNQADLDDLLLREATAANAKSEIKAAIKARGKKPPKVSYHTGIRQAVAEELASKADALARSKSAKAGTSAASHPTAQLQEGNYSQSATRRAMSMINENEFGEK